jgi:carboxymethylenebutenolidase
MTESSTDSVTQLEIDQRVFDLYDEYCHGRLARREFLRRAALVAGGLAMAQALLPRYAQAQTISFTDTRIKAQYVTYPSPGGNSGQMRGYLVQPAGPGPFPAVLVIHENRGLNPYIEDVARRAAVEGFVALAPDGLFPAGGYPGNDDDGRALQASLDQAKLRTDMLNSASVLKSHKLSSGKLGVTGFCWGGGTVNYLAVTMGSDLQAGVPFYGAAAEGAEDQGAPADPVRRERSAHQRDVARVRGRAESRRRAAPDAHLPGHPAWLPQQLDTPLPRSVGETGVGPHHRLLQENPGLTGRRDIGGDPWQLPT